ELAEEVFQLIEPFAGYAFNKAHSVSYAMIAYWTAYFKANYPEEYMAAVLNAHVGQRDKISSDVTECLRLGIPVLLPDVNRSEADFSIDINSDGKPVIRFGLASVKNVGSLAILPIVDERKEKGSYQSVEDLCRRADLGGVNRRAMESLLKVGALDSLGDRGSLLASVERIVSLAQREAQLKGSGQTTMFDLFGEEVSTPINPIEMEEGEVLRQERIDWEEDLLGTSISDSSWRNQARKAESYAVISLNDVVPEMAGQSITLVGRVSSQRSGLARDGKPFAAVELDLLVGSIVVMVWSNSYDKTRGLWDKGRLVEVIGKVRLRGDLPSITCDDAKPYVIEDGNGHTPNKDEIVSTSETSARTQNGAYASTSIDSPNQQNGTPPAPPTKLWIRLEESNNPGHDAHMLRGVVKLLKNYPGDGHVGLKISTDGKTVIGELPEVSVEYCRELHMALVDMVGEDGVEVVGWA
ncbi:MAG: OB-fold nucleic acid binding domain-containing protein, partial [Dehalococcoidia bacterium]|nr:OB-fold nucleic acid binding domain-containing protein [Dehalococcoidia bacterium]